jgi:5-formyltetrahydrofolate cyclo-ligase
MSDTNSKRTVREELLSRRLSLGPDERAAAATRIVGHLVAGLNERGSRVVAAYVPVGSEPGGQELPAALHEAGLTVLLPVVLPGMELDWCRYTGPESLAPARRGLLEPAGPRLGVDAVTDADVVVVPALAVDGRGYRLGRGGGCYDRTLVRVRDGVPIVALLYDGETLGAVPTEAHDLPVTAVITPSAGWREM